MNSPILSLLILAGIAVFLILRLRSVLGTRDGFEPTERAVTAARTTARRDFSVIEGGPDHDITDHVEEGSDAARALAARAAAGDLDPAAIDEATFAAALDTRDLPDPDLVIRTSGETRISNYLLWQSAYAEYEFTPILWPDFRPSDLAAILDRYGLRERRFGAAVGL